MNLWNEIYAKFKKSMQTMKYHALKWFQNRRGKKIYRKPIRIKTRSGWRKCCDMCEKTEILVDGKGFKDYAEYLFTCQNELKIEYFDHKQNET